MINKLTKSLKKFKKWEQKNPYIFLIVLFFTVVLAIPTGMQVFNITNNYYQNTIAWKQKEQEIINKLAPTQTKEYFDSILGPPIAINSGEKYRESIYKRRGYWVQAVYNIDGRVQMMSILLSVNDFKPVVKNTPLYKSVTLGKDSMQTVAQDGYIPHYFISGATAPSYIIDEIPAINPTRYQTFYFGANDAAPFDPKGVLKDNYYYDTFHLNSKINIKDPKIEYLRKNMPINIIAITAPHIKIEDLRSNFFIGVDRNQIRVLPGYSDKFLQDIY